jgi:hypothetical protein
LRAPTATPGENEEEKGENSMIRIDNPRFGEPATFDTLGEAQTTIRECGEDFASVTLKMSVLGFVYDERGEKVGENIKG